MLCGMTSHTRAARSRTLGTPKARSFGSAVREARGEGRSLRAVAKELNIDPSRLSKIENGKVVPRPEVAERILDYLGVTGNHRSEVLALLEGAETEQPWVATTLPEQRQHLSAIVAFEDEAAEIVEYTMGKITGLLQTKSYAQSIMSGGRRPLPPSEANIRVMTRMGRQGVLSPERKKRTSLTAFIHVTALRQNVGGPDVMLEQLEYLLKMMQRDNVTVLLVPDGIGWHEGLEGDFALITPHADAELYPVVFLEYLRSGLILHADEDVAAYRDDAVDSLQQLAMTSTATEEVIAGAIEALKGAPARGLDERT